MYVIMKIQCIAMPIDTLRPNRTEGGTDARELQSSFEEDMKNAQYESAERTLRCAKANGFELHLSADVLVHALRKGFDDLFSQESATRLFSIAYEIGLPFSTELTTKVAQDAFNEYLSDDPGVPRYLSALRWYNTLCFLEKLNLKLRISADQLRRMFIDGLGTDQHYSPGDVLHHARLHDTIPQKELMEMAYIEGLAQEGRSTTLSPGGEVVDEQRFAQQGLDLAVRRGNWIMAQDLLDGDYMDRWEAGALHLSLIDLREGIATHLRKGDAFRARQMRDFARKHHFDPRSDPPDLRAGLDAAFTSNRLDSGPGWAESMIDFVTAENRAIDIAPSAQRGFEYFLFHDHGTVLALKSIKEACEKYGIEINMSDPMKRRIRMFLDQDRLGAAAFLGIFADKQGIRFDIEGGAREALQRALSRFDLDGVCALAPVMILHGGRSDFEEVFREFFRGQLQNAGSDRGHFFDSIRNAPEYADLGAILAKMHLEEEGKRFLRSMNDPGRLSFYQRMLLSFAKDLGPEAEEEEVAQIDGGGP